MNKYTVVGLRAKMLVHELAHADIPNLPIGQVVEVGNALWTVSHKASAALDKVKGRLREEARKLGQTAQFDGEDGARCQVLLHSPQPKVTNPEELKEVLGPAFDTLFETVVTHKLWEDFDTRLLTLPPEQQQAILQRLQMADLTPRVSFLQR